VNLDIQLDPKPTRAVIRPRENNQTRGLERSKPKPVLIPSRKIVNNNKGGERELENDILIP
jgi:hypothetical protein